MFINCTNCSKKLTKKAIEEIIEMCGVDAEKEWWSCKKCSSKTYKELLDTLSEAMFGEAWHYNSFNDIDIDDFPGHKG